jgi:hypothetical protein
MQRLVDLISMVTNSTLLRNNTVTLLQAGFSVGRSIRNSPLLCNGWQNYEVTRVVFSGVGVRLVADSQSTSKSEYRASFWDPWPGTYKRNTKAEPLKKHSGYFIVASSVAWTDQLKTPLVIALQYCCVVTYCLLPWKWNQQAVACNAQRYLSPQLSPG